MNKYNSLQSFLKDNPSFNLSEGALADGDWEDEVCDWLRDQGFHVFVCEEDAIAYSLAPLMNIELGTMQVSREQLDAIKLAWNHDTDYDAIDHLVNSAQGGFSDLVESSGYIEAK